MEFNPILHKIRTPIKLFNITGVGGFEQGTLLELWGNPKSGKSTFCYQTAQAFLEDYGDTARVLILDAENSANLLRLKTVFNLKPCNVGRGRDLDERVFVEPAITLEQGMNTTLKYIKQAKDDGKFLLVIWDSITVSSPEKEYEEILASVESDKEVNNFSGGMMLRPRVLKFVLNQILAHSSNAPVTVLLINQATTAITRFGGREDSSGGYGLKHNIHYRIQFNWSGATQDKENDSLKTETLSQVTVNKSKHIPSLQKIPIVISDTDGGRIDPSAELITFLRDAGVIKKKGAWNTFGDELIDRYAADHGNLSDDEVAKLKKNFMQNDARTRQDILDVCTWFLTGWFRDKYTLVNAAYEEYETELKFVPPSDVTPVDITNVVWGSGAKKAEPETVDAD